jgi:fatty-acyl-CoA synthase
VATIAELVRSGVSDQRVALCFEDWQWTYDEYARQCARRAAWLLAHRSAGPFHVGVLLEVVPEYSMWLGAAALAGAVVVGINPTRRGPELAGDVRHSDCQLMVTDGVGVPLLEEAELGALASGDRVVVVDGTTWSESLAPLAGVEVADIDVEIDESTPFALIFTSGTTAGQSKAVRWSQGHLAFIGSKVAEINRLTSDDVCYSTMPLLHSNGLQCGWTAPLAVGATIAMRGKFSASRFLDDVRRYQATYFNYIGKALAYILTTPARPDDADNPLVRGFGNEAADVDIKGFERRFDCSIKDGYGSTEGGMSVSRVPGMPEGALGIAPEGVKVVDPDSLIECPRARFAPTGALLNAGEAIGEMVNTNGRGQFEGYYRNEQANDDKLRNGWFWSGDLGYRDDNGFFYFAGRSYDWIRVDGENFSAGPLERIIGRAPGVAVASVYGVPDPETGDQVMVTLLMGDGEAFDPDRFARFLEREPSLGTKWMPRFVRVTALLPTTVTNKVLKRQLRSERWDCDDPVWWRPGRADVYVPLTDNDRAALTRRFVDRGLGHVLARV